MLPILPLLHLPLLAILPSLYVQAAGSRLILLPFTQHVELYDMAVRH